MSYKINNIDLSTFGITPIQQSGQSLAVTGVFDFPNRKGETERSWGTEIEQFVSAADLEFEGRDISFKGLMRGTTRADILSKLTSLTTLCKSGTLTFETRVGIFQVFASGEIQVVELCDTVFIVEIKFRQNVVLFPTAPGVATVGTGYKLAGYSFKSDFGIIVNSIAGRLNTASRIEVKTTDFYANINYRDLKDVKIGCTMLASNLPDLTNKMGRLHGLLSQPGLKTLTYPDGTTDGVYLKGGFIVSGITEYACQFTLNLRS